jgi:acetylornithine deacetylase/succinyl-diaminopimelate desuccinylase-like protein
VHSEKHDVFRNSADAGRLAVRGFAVGERSDVVGILQTLLRVDTTNRGAGDAEGELPAALWIRDQLLTAGLEPVVLARDDAPHRANVVVRIAGTEPGLEGLLVHGHLDVVPAEPDQWTFDPFGGELIDGYVTGRGAMDMKDMCAMTLAVLLDWAATGERPRRDVVVAFVADEETDGAYGAQWLVDHHPELFAGVAVGIGESGGVVEEHRGADGQPVRLVRIAAGERGTLHLRLTATGESGHGSRPTDGSALLALVDALHRIGHHPWPLHVSPLVRAELEQAAAALGVACDLSTDEGVQRVIDELDDAAGVARFTIRASTTPTVVRAGYKVNVIPGAAEAEIDVRCPVGYEDELLRTLPSLVGDAVTFEHIVRESPVEAPVDGPWFDAMVASVGSEDPQAVVIPSCLGGGTDAKAFSGLGIACYGFAPATLDPDGRRRSGMHGIDERVPIASLEGGRRILAHFLRTV